MAVFDIAAVYVALPKIEASLGAGISDAQWIASAYGLMEAGFTLAAGTLGDLWGRRRVYVYGIAIFTLASVASGLAPNPVWLIASRFMQGIGGAIMMALPLAMLSAMARNDGEREAGIRMYGTVAGLGAVVAPVVSGALVQYLGWRSIFFVNVPIAMFVLYTALMRTPESAKIPGKRLDAGGQFASALALIAFSYVAIEGNGMGWTSPTIVAAFALALVSSAAFVGIERRSPSPMIRFSALRQPALAAAAGSIFIMNAGFFAIYLIATLFLQGVKGVSPAQTGMFLLANNLGFFVANLWSGPAVKRIGPRNAGLIGMAGGALGIALLLAFDARTPAAALVIPLAVTGLAWGFAITPLNALALDAAPPSETGLDSGILKSGRPLGAVIATAIFGSVIAESMGDRLTSLLSALQVAPRVAQEFLAGIRHGGSWVTPAPIAGVPEAAIRAALDTGFVIGMHRTAAVAALVSAASVLAAWITTRSIAGRPEGGGSTKAGSVRP